MGIVDYQRQWYERNGWPLDLNAAYAENAFKGDDYDICEAQRQYISRIDGGPGSGNWGHAGRPGSRGGSGAGGGKQYRLSTKEGGFVGINGVYKENEKWNAGSESKKKLEDVKKRNKDKLHPDSIAGVNRAAEMTFEEADTGNVNPSYGTAKGYDTNCQTCVGVFEARQRGYDVEATPNTEGSLNEKLSHDQGLMWIDPKTGEHCKPQRMDDTVTTPKRCLAALENIVKRGERYTFGFAWKGRERCGHIINLDRANDGQLRLKDNQRGRGEKSEWIGANEVLEYLGRIRYTMVIKIAHGVKINVGPRILRIDDKMFDPDMSNAIFKPRSAK